MKSNFPSFLNMIRGFYVILMRYVFKLTGLRSKGWPKMCKLFFTLCAKTGNVFIEVGCFDIFDSAVIRLSY